MPPEDDRSYFLLLWYVLLIVAYHNVSSSLIFMRTPSLSLSPLSLPTSSSHCMHPPLSLSNVSYTECMCVAIVASFYQLELSWHVSILVTTYHLHFPLASHSYMFSHQKTWLCKTVVAPLPQWTPSIICWLLRTTLNTQCSPIPHLAKNVWCSWRIHWSISDRHTPHKVIIQQPVHSTVFRR